MTHDVSYIHATMTKSATCTNRRRLTVSAAVVEPAMVKKASAAKSFMIDGELLVDDVVLDWC